MKDCLGIVNLDEKENNMNDLSINEGLSVIPIAGKYRIIDFVMSNMSNSGVNKIGIFTKKKSRFLINYLENGKAWDLNRKESGLKIFNYGEYDLEYDDIHNFADNIEFLKKSKKKYVLISPSYMICNIDYNKAIKKHISSNNDITVIYKEVDSIENKFINCDILDIDKNEYITSIRKNIAQRTNFNVSMEMYIMKMELFIDIIEKSITNGTYTKVKTFINNNLGIFRVGSYRYNGYLACVNSVKMYFNTNIELLNKDINNELFYQNKFIYTKIKDESPAQYSQNSSVSNSIVSNGSIIEGQVKNCIIGRKVHIKEGSSVINSIIMEEVMVEKNANIQNVIAIDGVIVKEKQKISGTIELPHIISKLGFIE